jgi:hypothetical protein
MSSAHQLQVRHAWQSSDLAFLAIALLLHAALLLVPLAYTQPDMPSPARRLTVDLQQIKPTGLVEPEQPEEQAVVGPPSELPGEQPGEQPLEPAVELPGRRTARIVMEDLPSRPEPHPQSPVPEESAPPTIKQLRDWLSRSRLDDPATEPAQQLGTAREYQPPANWSRNAGAPYLAESDNTFNGMTVPEDVEIVDRWLAEDGSHNVVLNLPNGDTLCGRAEPYNPAQPLVEHIMMFRYCGGGGKRTFSMPERYNQGQ